MGRHARVLSLIEWSNGFWYYRLQGMKGYRTTGTQDHHQAVLFTQEKMKSAELLVQRRAPLLKEYSADFFVWDRCPHCRKLREEGRQITKRHAYNQRLLLEKYLLTDPIADKPLRRHHSRGCVELPLAPGCLLRLEGEHGKQSLGCAEDDPEGSALP